MTLDAAPLTGEERKVLLHVKRRIDTGNQVIGDSAPILRVFERIHELNQGDITKPVVLLGETGVGKTLLASLIVKSSKRSDPRRYAEFGGARLAGADFNIAKGELFGYGKGHGLQNVPEEGKPGLLDRCRGGTVFIDELSWLPCDMQALLLKILDGAGFQRVGDLETTHKSDVRFIFATNKDPDNEVKKGSLLFDLWRRIREFTVVVPPLRERKEDIPLITRALLGDRTLDPRVLLALLLHNWPGNVGELRDRLGKVKKEPGKKVGLGDLKPPTGVAEQVLGMSVDDAEGKLTKFLLLQLRERGFEHGRGLNKELARLLGVSPAKVSNLIKQART